MIENKPTTKMTPQSSSPQSKKTEKLVTENHSQSLKIENDQSESQKPVTTRRLDEEPASQVRDFTSTTTTSDEEGVVVVSGRERLKRHRGEVAGPVWIPEIWGQEELLKDWIDCTAFDASLVNSQIMSARAAMVEEGRRIRASPRRIENRC